MFELQVETVTHRCAKTNDARRDEVEGRVHVFAVLPHVQHEALGEGRRQPGPLGHVGEHICHGAVHGPVRQSSAAQLLPRWVSGAGRDTGERGSGNMKCDGGGR